jgi:hypothetical protein
MHRLPFAVLLGLSCGCQQPSSPSTPPASDKTDIHIRTPKTNVDVHGKGNGLGADANVERKER